MYAIIRTGGKQYRVAVISAVEANPLAIGYASLSAVGDTVKVETIEAEAGSEVTLSDVLLVATDEGIKAGKLVLEGASVKATVVSHGRHDKVRIFKFRRRKHSMKSAGHRQNYTELKIEAINA